MPTLLELQRAMRASLVDRDDGAIAAMLADGIEADRLNIYRNTFVIGATRALRLNFPAVHKLVGEAFFEGAAAIFIADHPPRAAWLDNYGAEFPDFLKGFEPAARVAYLPDIARLEWAVSRAIHAPDREPLALARLSGLEPEEHARVTFVPHPSIALLSTDYPADVIWRATLDGDDAALAAVKLDAGPVHLLIARRDAAIEVIRLDEAAWRFAVALCEGRTIDAALAEMPDARAYTLLAEHLAAGRFIDFRLATDAASASAPSPQRAAP
jgi:hypothetical protein